jgi:pimeloyl-ACP methyl ester carboxylesterase
MKKLLQKIVPKLYGYYFNITNVFSGNKAADSALKVFSFPRKGKILPYQNEFLDTARKQRIAFEDGLFLLYHWKGEGKTVLLNHGWESNAWRWKHLIEPLQKKGFNIIAIDAPAHGASDGTLFTAVKYSRVIKTTIDLYEPAIVISHSVGAMATVYQEAQEVHDCIKKLILLGGPNSLEVIMRNYQTMTGFNDKVYDNLNDLLKKTFGMKIEEFNTSAFAKAIKVPTLLIHNRDDMIVPFKSVEQIAEAMPDATIFEASTGGHSLHTVEVVGRIVEFLD